MVCSLGILSSRHSKRSDTLTHPLEFRAIGRLIPIYRVWKPTCSAYFRTRHSQSAERNARFEVERQTDERRTSAERRPSTDDRRPAVSAAAAAAPTARTARTATAAAATPTTITAHQRQRQQEHADDDGDDKNGLNVAASGWRDENGFSGMGWKTEEKTEHGTCCFPSERCRSTMTTDFVDMRDSLVWHSIRYSSANGQ